MHSLGPTECLRTGLGENQVWRFISVPFFPSHHPPSTLRFDQCCLGTFQFMSIGTFPFVFEINPTGPSEPVRIRFRESRIEHLYFSPTSEQRSLRCKRTKPLVDQGSEGVTSKAWPLSTIKHIFSSYIQ